MNMDDKSEENEQFKMRFDTPDEDIDGRGVPSEVDELRLEKISQRVTMISVMIPVLIVIVLVIAYLDIKKRVVQTEDSGAFEFSKLSSDLESRFSSLSLRQAKLEETLEKLTTQSDHAMASIQVRMEKLHDAIGDVRKDALGVKQLEAVKEDLVKQINGVVASANDASKQTDAILQELQGQVIQQGERQVALNTLIAEAQKNYQELDSRKIDKQALDLSLRLEALKIETAVKTQIDTLQEKIKTLEQQLSRLSAQAARPTPTPAPSPTPSGTPSDLDTELETHTITR